MYLFIDTNIFLHFVSFDQIDWARITGASDNILVLANIVLHELDKHKYSPREKLRNRASTVIKKIDLQIEQGENQKNKIILYNGNVETILEKHSFDANDQDNLLLASMLCFAQENDLGSNQFSLVTNDLGPKLKAKQFGIQVVNLDEKYRLPFEEDKLNKELKRLNKEILSIKNRRPNLKILFTNKDKVLKLCKNKSELVFDDYIKTQLEIFDTVYQPFIISEIEKPKRENDLKSFQANWMSSVFGISNQQKKAYNDELVKFRVKYESYLITKYSYDLRMQRCFDIDLLLLNDGESVAQDVDIHLHFPDGFTLYDEDSCLKAPIEPSPPPSDCEKTQRLISKTAPKSVF
jgi:predicted ribonuclease YlaK